MFSNSFRTAVVWLLALCATVCADDPSVRRNDAVRLRLEWGGGQPHVWTGVVESGGGRLRELVSLGVEADEPGTVWIDGNAVWIRRTSGRLYDGFDVTIADVATDASLAVTLQADGEALEHKFQIRLSEVSAEGQVFELGESDGRLSVRRTPGDELSVQIGRPHLIFLPGEQLRATVLPNLPPSVRQAGRATFDWRLGPARSRQILRTGEFDFSWNSRSDERTTLPLNVSLPNKEGVYDIHLRVRQRRRVVAESVVQVVVLSAQPPPSEVAKQASSQPEIIDAFQPDDAGLFRRVDKRRSIQLFNASMDRIIDSMPGLFDATEPQAKQSAVAWRAYRLRIKHPGRAHRLVLTFREGSTPRAGASILEPNAAGQLLPFGLDGGIFTPHAATSDRRQREYAVLFWPRVTDPVLLLHDLGLGSAVDVEHVEILELDRLAPAEPPATHSPDLPKRLVGPYMHKPLLGENFGATEALDSASGRSLKDWVTFQTAAERLVAYLRHTGANSLLLGAFVDGGAIYPSGLLQPTARYETGIYFSTGQDPIRKDVLELLFQHFDREQLLLVPEMQFSTPLPELERLLAVEGDAARGIELIGKGGRSWREARGTARGLAPYYNPLDPRVQQAVRAAVCELVERYAEHPSFQHVAVQLSSAGYLQLPGLDWGYDDTTVARFEQETGERIQSGPPAEKDALRFEYLTGAGLQKWTRWRCEQLASFHRELAADVARIKPGAQLILSGKQILRGENADDNVYATIKTGHRPQALLQAKGLDFSLHAKTPNLTILKPRLWRLSGLHQLELLDESFNNDAEVESLFALPRRGALFYREPVECRIPEFDGLSPWQPAFTWLAAECTPGALDKRRRLAQSLALSDAQFVFDGSWMIPLGDTGQAEPAHRVLRELPAIDFIEHENDQPVVVRFGRTAERTYVYVVNEMPGGISATLRVACGSQAECRILGRTGEPNLTRGDGGAALKLELEPYDVWGCVLNDPAARIVGVEARPAQLLLDTLAARLESFQHRMAEARQSTEPQRNLLANAGFEDSMPGATLVGWEVPDPQSGRWELDPSQPRSGTASLCLVSGNAGGAGVTADVPLGDSRMLSLCVWLRSDSSPADARLEFEAVAAGTKRLQSADVRVDSTWRKYQFHVKDIPAGQLSDPKVRIRLLGAGKLWIDDVDVETQRVTSDDLRQLMKVFSATMLAWENQRYTECERLLQSYWGQFLFDDVPAATIDPARTAVGTPRAQRN